MKKFYSTTRIIKTSVFILCLLSFFISSAKVVEINSARQVAEKFLLKNKNLKSSEILNLSYTLYENNNSLLKSDNSTPTLYIFTDSNNNFVIVSAEDATFPILGYSHENNFSNNMPEEFNNLLMQYSRQITKVRKAKTPSTEKIKSTWENPIEVNSDENDVQSVLPLLSSKWGQTYPYNMLCPADPNGSGGHTLVGCTATALAQLLNYYNYPNKGNGTISYTDPKYGLIEKNLSESIYNWKQMPDEINSSNQEIAKLMYDCAISIETSFDTNGSASSITKVVEALKNNFNYSNNLKRVQSGDYTYEAWVSLLKNSLLNSNPIYYDGAGRPAGHAMICDGFENDYFHFNFGWKGNYNGYFLLGSITPDNGYVFSYLQRAIIDVQPSDSELAVDFQIDKNVGVIPFNVNFVNKSIVSGQIEKIEWDFNGDGVYDSEEENPYYSYGSAGEYNVTLKITTENNSAFKTKTSLINVLDDSPQNVIIDDISDNYILENQNYYITKNIIIPNNKSLIIHPGSKLHFLDSCKLIVYGSIQAEGTKLNPIEFKSLNSNNYWRGITFYGDQNSILSNCIIENCENNMYKSEYNVFEFFSAITIYNDNVIIEHCSILNNNCRAFEISASPIIRNNIVTNNNHADGAGFMIRGGNPLICNNKIYKNTGWNGGGAMHIRNCSARVLNNYLCNNLYGAIKTFKIKNLVIEGNIICNNFNTWSGGGGGIKISGDESSNVIINNNTICNNYAPRGSALSIYGTEPSFYNNIIWGNAKTCEDHTYTYITLSEGIYPKFYNCIIEGLTNEIDVENDLSEYPQNHLINCSGNEPKFINPTPYWDGDEDLIKNSDGIGANWNIKSNSTCIDNGMDVNLLFNYDISGKRRFWDGNNDGVTRIDIGALEFNSVYDDTIQFCENSAFSINGEIYSIPGEYIDTLSTINNEDSVIIYQAIEFESYEIINDTTICNGEEYNGWIESGTYSQTFQTINGCDSIIITNLIIIELPNPDFYYEADTLIAANTYSTYQWYNQNGIIEGATSPRYVIDKSGTFFLEVTNSNGCSAISDSQAIIKTGINDIKNNQHKFVVYPNPNDGRLKLTFTNLKIGKYRVQIINDIGDIVFEKDLYLGENVHEEEIELSGLSRGIYFAKIFDKEITETRKIILK